MTPDIIVFLMGFVSGFAVGITAAILYIVGGKGT